MGLDYGYAKDPTAIVEVGLSDDEIYIDEVCYRTEMLTSDIINELRPFRKYEMISESADPRMIQEIANAGYLIYPVIKYAGSREAGIQKMLEYKIKITKRSVNVIKEFKNYTYTQDKDGRWTNVPIDDFDNAIDAVRYIILAKVLGKIKPQNITKVDLGIL